MHSRKNRLEYLIEWTRSAVGSVCLHLEGRDHTAKRIVGIPALEAGETAKASWIPSPQDSATKKKSEHYKKKCIRTAGKKSAIERKRKEVSSVRARRAVPSQITNGLSDILSIRLSTAIWTTCSILNRQSKTHSWIFARFFALLQFNKASMIHQCYRYSPLLSYTIGKWRANATPDYNLEKYLFD